MISAVSKFWGLEPRHDSPVVAPQQCEAKLLSAAKRENIWSNMLSRSPLSDLDVKELFPSQRDDFLLFFDQVAFADNHDWSDCHCSAYHFMNKEKAESRRDALSLIEADRMHGFLTYDNRRPVGWCNAASRYGDLASRG